MEDKEKGYILYSFKNALQYFYTPAPIIHHSDRYFTPDLPLALARPVSCFGSEVQIVGVTNGDTIKVVQDGKQIRVRLVSVDCPT